MKKGGIIILALILILGYMGCNSYNGMVSGDESVKKAWADVQNQYQRRVDLVDNLVATVKGAAKHEEETLTKVIEARAKATSIQVDPNQLTPEKLKEFQSAQGELSQALGRLMVSVEQYPNLKANENFLNLQAQLEGTENRIASTRADYNEVVQNFNKKVRSFPANIFAKMFGFREKATFEAQPGADKAPKVEF